MLRSSAIALLMTTAWLGMPRAGQAQLDSVLDVRGNSALGTIVEMSRDQVKVETTSGPRIVPVNEIQRVQFSDEPRELRRARDAMLRGELERGRAELEQVSADDIRNAFVRQDLEFYKAWGDGKLALLSGGDKASAVRALRTFLENPQNQDNYHYYETVELLGDLAVALNSYDNAVRYYRMLAEAPWPDYQLRATLSEARSLASNEQYGEALARYESVINNGLESPEVNELKRLAIVGKAVALGQTGAADEGVALLLELLGNHDSEQHARLFGRAYNALGVCYMQQGKTQEALMAFLHTDLIFNNEAEVHAEALYYLNGLWREINKVDRAIAARSMLQSRYAGTRWAQQ